MKLELMYNAEAGHAVRGAYLRGTDPLVWLQTLDGWGLRTLDVECYVLPHSLANPAAAGLFVCFGKDVDASHLDVLHPFGLIGEKLYLPCTALLHPPVTAQELMGLLIWERQVFHPAIGLVGFGDADRVDLADLLELADPRAGDWGRAHPGLDPRPPLRWIAVKQAPHRSLLDDAGAEIGKKRLEDMPEEGQDEESGVEKALRDLKKGTLKGAFNFTKKLNEAFSGEGSESDGPGMLDKMQGWLKGQLDDLEAKRAKEMDRLMELFESDPDEALKYAIPLSHPYENRGTARPGSRLGQRRVDFNLGRMGGGQAVDGWNVERHRAALRKRYLDAANRAIEARNFRKAAYIYAELLGDFHGAANVLEQGGHFREAAVIYKDHLKNVAAAAACLEKGGLLLEAIPLYRALDKDEKAADLYVALQQKDKADLLYQKCANAAVDRSDYAEAARLYLIKMELPKVAIATYLVGWKAGKQAKECLSRYLRLTVSQEMPDPEKRLRELYESLGAYQEGDFIEVVAGMQESRSVPEFTATREELVYKLVSEQARRGVHTHLHWLKNFHPGDKLIGKDIGRFLTTSIDRPKKKISFDPIQLDNSIEWLTGVFHRGQYLCLGTRSNFLYLARANNEGDIAYHSWTNTLPLHTSFQIKSYDFSDTLLLTSSAALHFEPLHLKSRPGFDAAVTIVCPVKAPDGLPAVTLLKSGHYLSFSGMDGGIEMGTYDQESNLLRKKVCTYEGAPTMGIEFPAPGGYIVSAQDVHFFTGGTLLYRTGNDGDLAFVEIGEEIYEIAVSQDFPRTVAVGGLENVAVTHAGNYLNNRISDEQLIETGTEVFDIRYVGKMLVVLTMDGILIYDTSNDRPRLMNELAPGFTPVCLLGAARRDMVGVMGSRGEIFHFSIAQG